MSSKLDLVDRLELAIQDDWYELCQEAREEIVRLRGPKLARNQPCGCVICVCDDPIRCHGCGGEACAEHNDGVIPEPLYETGESHAEMKEEIEQLRAAGFDVIQRIEAWEAAVRTIIGRTPGHGMDLTQLRAALPTEGVR